MGCYKLLPAAEHDLEAIWQYTAQEWGVRQADLYIDQLDEAFQLIAEQPLICRERNEFTPPVRIYHRGHHLVVYLINAADITVIRVLHESMDLDGQLSV
jgi:toxin ParE1/3/4